MFSNALDQSPVYLEVLPWLVSAYRCRAIWILIAAVAFRTARLATNSRVERLLGMMRARRADTLSSLAAILIWIATMLESASGGGAGSVNKTVFQMMFASSITDTVGATFWIFVAAIGSVTRVGATPYRGKIRFAMIRAEWVAVAGRAHWVVLTAFVGSTSSRRTIDICAIRFQVLHPSFADIACAFWTSITALRSRTRARVTWVSVESRLEVHTGRADASGSTTRWTW
jgi:hypothetical protein